MKGSMRERSFLVSPQVTSWLHGLKQLNAAYSTQQPCVSEKECARPVKSYYAEESGLCSSEARESSAVYAPAGKHSHQFRHLYSIGRFDIRGHWTHRLNLFDSYFW